MTMTGTSAFFSGTNNMDASNRLPFFPADFRGRLRVCGTKGITKRDGVRMFIAELEVLESNLPNVEKGSKYSWCQNMKEIGTAYPACIGFLWACLGLDANRDRAKIEKEIKPKQDQWLNSASVEGNTVLVDAEILLQTNYKPLKGQLNLEEAIKNGKVFTLHTFFPAPAAA